MSKSSKQSQRHSVTGENELVDGAADVGVAFATMRLGVGTLIALVFLAIGVYLLLSPASESQAGTGTITAITDGGQVPTTYDSNGYPVTSTQRVYTLEVQYTCGGTAHKFNMIKQAYAGTYSVGGTTPVEFNPNQCSDVRAATTSNASIGLILCAVGLVTFLISFVWWYVVRHSKTAAAVSGVSDVAGMFTSSFRGGGGGGRWRR
jgi:hypothetical protein